MPLIIAIITVTITLTMYEAVFQALSTFIYINS